ncbi:[citrate (pro-3S)-lyase] ligase [Schnuerera ultunensis]|uniref:[Citrate [pro-3S]-lyase] ligase n=1 Tax=[Clostridium] ultunense Esp TaxID=1288971 RepID=A0A1M4PPY0_9FIRM|nr:[citrate (pro-3S)-lyase] ligase [Schnuerera ultunensis]SHD77537.1 Citrate lyase ligase [[Clostridium] ultunense Esp]
MSLIIEKIDLEDKERLQVEQFLSEFNLSLDRDVEETIVAKMDGKMVGTCSYAGKVIKSFAVKKELQGEGIAGKLISQIRNIMFDKGIFHTFIFTKPENKYIFRELGYLEVFSTRDVTLLESSSNNLSRYIETIKRENSFGDEEKAAIVMNCNPFTLGHRYLIERSALENERVIVFIVQEDKSAFPFDVRYKLVKEGIKDLCNVHVVPGGDYIISSNTFPSYFIKEEEDKDRAYKQLDAGIFSKHIAKAFNIKRRYLGTEPYCSVTNGYNQVLAEILPEYGIEVRIVDRLIIDGKVVSASMVRKNIKEDNWKEIKKLVPEITYSFLLSSQSKEIIEKIKGSESRH